MPHIVITTTTQQTAADYGLARSNKKDERRIDGWRKTMSYYVLKWMKSKNKEKYGESNGINIYKGTDGMVVKIPPRKQRHKQSGECEAFSSKGVMGLPWVMFQSYELLVLTRENRQMNNRWCGERTHSKAFLLLPPSKATLKFSIIIYHYVFSSETHIY